jgi:uncharacterized protein (DUF58 family)
LRKTGFPGVVVLLILFLFIPYYPVRLLLIVPVAVVLLSHLYVFSLKRSLHLHRRLPFSAVYKDQPLRISVTVENRGFLPVFNTAFVDSLGGLTGDGGERRLFSLPPRQKKVIEYEIKGHNRGIFELGPLTLSGMDPLGLLSWTKTEEEKHRLIVYPHIFPLHLIYRRGLPGGPMPIQNKWYEDMTRYRLLREYVPGDDTRRIHWKVSARRGSLHTLEYLPSLSSSMVVFLNMNIADYAPPRKYLASERAVETAASLVMAGIRDGQSVGFRTNAGEKSEKRDGGRQRGSPERGGIPPGAALEHGKIILESLARLRAFISEDEDLASMLSRVSVPFGGRFVYVGPALKDEDLEYLASSREGRGMVELYYVSWRKEDKGGPLPPGWKRCFVPSYGDMPGSIPEEREAEKR